MFETLAVLLRESARVVARRIESVALVFLARTPPALARLMRLGGAAPRVALDVASKVEEEVAEAAGKAIEEVVDVAAPLFVAGGLRRFVTPRRLAAAAVVLVGAAAGAAALKRSLRGR